MTTTMTVENLPLDLTMAQAVTLASTHAVNQALQQFLQAPSVSNKVATMVALQAYFAEVEGRRNC